MYRYARVACRQTPNSRKIRSKIARLHIKTSRYGKQFDKEHFASLVACFSISCPVQLSIASVGMMVSIVLSVRPPGSRAGVCHWRQLHSSSHGGGCKVASPGRVRCRSQPASQPAAAAEFTLGPCGCPSYLSGTRPWVC
ncbi:unnamed protein product [Pylaiella littoralis]